MTAEQLRNSILQEAISGRLVPQDPNDEPASALLTRIREEKARLVKEGKLKKKDLVETPITEEEIPFEIPSSWEWVRWGNLAFSIMYGYNAPAEDNGDIRMVRISDIQDNKVLWGKVPFCRIKPSDIETYLLKPNDILFARTGGTVGKSYIVNEVPYPSIYAGYLIRTQYSKQLCPKYLKYFMESRLYWSQLRDETIATAQPNCNGKKLAAMMLPLPPLAEQERIVAKLEELLPIVEQYGKAQKELDELNAALPARLRQSILQEAIHGKLVPQDEKEGTAEELLKLIDAEKQRLVKERILKKAIRTSAIIPEDSPFEIPTSWLWANLEDVTYAVGGRENQILSKEILKEGKIRVVSQGQAIYDGYCNDATKEINDLPVILFGDHTRNVKYINFPFVIGADGTKLFRPIGIYPRYLYYWMKYAASTLRNRGYARHYTLLKVVPVPLPPLAEQKRIVAKIEELFAEIDKLK